MWGGVGCTTLSGNPGEEITTDKAVFSDGWRDIDADWDCEMDDLACNPPIRVYSPSSTKIPIAPAIGSFFVCENPALLAPNGPHS
jgi:hypothetical protein